MPRKTLSATGIVLVRELTAGGFERLRILTAEALLGVMRRPGHSAKAAVAPDLFDLCTVELDARSGGAWFMREYTLEHRYSGIGASYETLAAASQWARLILTNAPSMDGTAAPFEISLKALDAWERGAPAQVVLLKALFLFAKAEGLPVREEWLAQLPPDERRAVSAALGTPLDESAGADAAVLTAMPGLMTEWMCESHHILKPR
ncbi:MAG: hypothetical protein WC360_03590 [Opitutales bacterium]|jgi:hypothetical protein